MARPDTSRYQTFGDITGRLDDIVAQVRDKDVSLERSLDLFDEAIALGSKAVDLVDATDFSPEEEAKLDEADGADKAASALTKSSSSRDSLRQPTRPCAPSWRARSRLLTGG